MRGIRRTYGSARVRKSPAVAGKMLAWLRRRQTSWQGYGIARCS